MMRTVHQYCSSSDDGLIRSSGPYRITSTGDIDQGLHQHLAVKPAIVRTVEVRRNYAPVITAPLTTESADDEEE
jgi:hypothetical protein